MSDTVRVDYAYDRAEVTNTNLTYSHINPALVIDNPSGNSGIAFTNLINSGAAQFFDFNRSGRRPDEIFSAVEIPEAENEIDGHQITVSWTPNETSELKYIYAQRNLFDSTPTNLSTGARTDGYRLDNEPIFSFPVAAQAGGAAVCQPSCVGRSVQYGEAIPDVSQEQWSHELQFSSDLFDGRVSYITGLYLFEETADAGAGTVAHLISAPLGSNERGDNTGNRIEVLTQASSEIENTAAAVFAQFTWTPQWMDERLSLTLGARHSRDRRKARQSRRQITFIVVPGDGDNTDRDNNDIGTQLSEAFYNVPGDKRFRDDSFSFIAEYDLTDSINLYAKQSEAYKSGGFNLREQLTPAGAARAQNGFDEEKVEAIEIGIKSRFFDNRLQINADIFEQEITDQQLNFSVPNAVSDTTVANAGFSVLKGFEMDTTWLVAEGLILILNYAYLDSNIEPSVNPLSGETDDGFVFDSAPRHAYTAAIDWTLWQGGAGSRIAFNATYSFTDERNGGGRKEFADFNADRQDDFALLNTRLGWYDMPVFDGTLTAAVWAKNLLDEEYSVNNVHNLPQASRSVMFGEPRSFGLDLIYFWGG